jgi:hypothetical protein
VVGAYDHRTEGVKLRQVFLTAHKHPIKAAAHHSPQPRHKQSFQTDDFSRFDHRVSSREEFYPRINTDSRVFLLTRLVSRRVLGEFPLLI